MLPSSEAGRSGGLDSAGPKSLHGGGGLLQETETQRRGDASQLAIDGAGCGWQVFACLGVEEALPGAAAMLDEGVGDEFDEGGKGKKVLEAASAMLLENPRQATRLKNMGPEQKNGLSQWKASERLASKGLWLGLPIGGVEHRLPPKS